MANEQTGTKQLLSTDEAMRARHSVRKYQPGVTIPAEDLNEILELAATAPSSWNLQHWRFLVIQDQANKERLLPIAYNQQQVVECSANIVILGDLEANKEAEGIYGPALAAGNLPQKAYDTLVGNIHAAYAGNNSTPLDEANRNASLAAMQLMLAAKAKGYDTVPMGGFDRQKLIEAYNIPSRYYPVMLISLGTAAVPAHPTGRFSLDKLVIKESF